MKRQKTQRIYAEQAEDQEERSLHCLDSSGGSFCQSLIKTKIGHWPEQRQEEQEEKGSPTRVHYSPSCIVCLLHLGIWMGA